MLGGVQVVDLLIIDDEVTIRRGVERIVDTEGFTVAGVSGGDEALELIDGGLRPRVVFSNAILADKSGAELIDRLRRLPELAGVRIYLMGEGSDRVASADGHIEKPFDVVEMLEIIARRCR